METLAAPCVQTDNVCALGWGLSFGLAKLTGTRCKRRTSNLSSSHSTVVPSMRTKGNATVVCHSSGDLRMRLLSVSRILL